jgi:hypothetical protein
MRESLKNSLEKSCVKQKVYVQLSNSAVQLVNDVALVYTEGECALTYLLVLISCIESTFSKRKGQAS